MKGVNKVVNSQAFGWLLIGGGAVIALAMYKKIKLTTISVVNSFQYAGSTLSSARVQQLASQIKGAWGIFNDDEEAVYNAFSYLNNNTDLEYLIATYATGGSDLIKDITRYMNAKERQKINNILVSKGIKPIF